MTVPHGGGLITKISIYTSYSFARISIRTSAARFIMLFTSASASDFFTVSVSQPSK